MYLEPPPIGALRPSARVCYNNTTTYTSAEKTDRQIPHIFIHHNINDSPRPVAKARHD